ncbi:MAG: DUF1223 domain-containing protein [Polyangiaceae bacterium]
MTHLILTIAALGLACASCATSQAGAAAGDVAPAESESRLPVVRTPEKADPPSRSPATSPKGSSKPAVVVELFSSEGCSSCPPADALLREIAATPRDDADVIALEMHVDYWNDLGWADPYSSPSFTERQRSYAEALGDGRIYTPQMVVDGAAGFVGSQRGTARAAIARAAASPKARVTISRSGSPEVLRVQVSDVPAPKPRAEVLLAFVEDGLSSDVTRGENAGSTLAHAPVVRALKRLDTMASGAPSVDIEVPETPLLQSAWRRSHLRAVALVQSAETRAILGAAWVSMD